MPPDLRHLPKRLGDGVRGLRRTAGITQMTLGEKAGLTLTYVGEVERGEKLASLDTIVRLATALGVSASELLKRSGL